MDHTTERSALRMSHSEWADRQGGNPAYDAGWLLYPSGARCSDSGSVSHEPPTDPLQLCNRKRQYYQALVRQIGEDLAGLKNKLSGYLVHYRWSERRYGPMPQSVEGAVNLLEQLLAEAKAKLEKFQAEYDRRTHVPMH